MNHPIIDKAPRVQWHSSQARQAWMPADVPFDPAGITMSQIPQCAPDEWESDSDISLRTDCDSPATTKSASSSRRPMSRHGSGSLSDHFKRSSSSSSAMATLAAKMKGPSYTELVLKNCDKFKRQSPERASTSSAGSRTRSLPNAASRLSKLNADEDASMDTFSPATATSKPFRRTHSAGSAMSFQTTKSNKGKARIIDVDSPEQEPSPTSFSSGSLPSTTSPSDSFWNTSPGRSNTSTSSGSIPPSHPGEMPPSSSAKAMPPPPIPSTRSTRSSRSRAAAAPSPPPEPGNTIPGRQSFLKRPIPSPQTSPSRAPPPKKKAALEARASSDEEDEQEEEEPVSPVKRIKTRTTRSQSEPDLLKMKTELVPEEEDETTKRKAPPLGARGHDGATSSNINANKVKPNAKSRSLGMTQRSSFSNSSSSSKPKPKPNAASSSNRKPPQHASSALIIEARNPPSRAGRFKPPMRTSGLHNDLNDDDNDDEVDSDGSLGEGRDEDVREEEEYDLSSFDMEELEGVLQRYD